MESEEGKISNPTLDADEEEDKSDNLVSQHLINAYSVSLLTGHRCPSCQKCMKSHKLLIKHYKKEHALMGKISCPEVACKALLCSASERLYHILTKHNSMYDFRCMFCDEEMADIEATKIHLGTRHVFGCYLCFEDMSTDTELEDHMKHTHSLDNKYRCDICSFSCNLSAVKKFSTHIKGHFNLNKHICRYCVPKQFYKDKNVLLEHVTERHDPGVPHAPFVCPDCPNYSSNSAKNLILHWQFGCIKPGCRKCGRQYRNIISRNSHEKTCGISVQHAYSCHQCSYRTTLSGHLTRHIHLIHEKQGGECKVNYCVICPRVAKANRSAAHPSLIVTKIPTTSKPSGHLRDCQFPKCGFQAKTDDQLRTHVKSVHKALATTSRKSGPYGVGRRWGFICDLCGKVLRDNYSLRGHGIAKHGLPSELSCEICEKSFSMPHNLSAHMRERHGVGKLKITRQSEYDAAEPSSALSLPLYLCEMCNFQTKYARNLSSHRQSTGHHKPTNENADQHGSKKPSKEAQVHSCPLCDYKTPPGMYNRALKRHLYSKHIRYGETIPDGYDVKIAKCLLCDYTALDESRITRHMKTHAKYGDPLPDQYIAFEIENNGSDN